MPSTTPWRFLIHKKDSFVVRLSKRAGLWFWKRKRKAASYRMASGRVLTDADIEALADEAEAGYDVEHLRRRGE